MHSLIERKRLILTNSKSLIFIRIKWIEIICSDTVFNVHLRNCIIVCTSYFNVILYDLIDLFFNEFKLVILIG